MRTTTGWLVTVVRLDVDLAGLLLVGDEWKAGALRARRAADWVGGSVLVSVVVVLGTEPVLAARSAGLPWASADDAWVKTAGTVSSDRTGWALGADVVDSPQRVDKTPREAGCRVVVVAVVVEMVEVVGGADVCREGGLGPRGVVAESGMVKFCCDEPPVNAWPLSDAG